MREIMDVIGGVFGVLILVVVILVIPYFGAKLLFYKKGEWPFGW